MTALLSNFKVPVWTPVGPGLYAVAEQRKKKVSLNSVNSVQEESAFWVQSLFMIQAILHFWAPLGQNWTTDQKRGYAKGVYIHLSNVFHKENPLLT